MQKDKNKKKKKKDTREANGSVMVNFDVFQEKWSLPFRVIYLSRFGENLRSKLFQEETPQRTLELPLELVQSIYMI